MRSSTSCSEQGELDNTAIFFTSDNGYFFGEHRIFLNKVYPYEEALRVPLVARIPPSALGPKARRDGQPPDVPQVVNNLDLSATILDLAGAAPCTAGGDCRRLDGRSLRPLLNGKRPDWTRGRALLYQVGALRTCGAIPTERGLNNYYDALRTNRYVYVELNRVNKETGQCDRPEYELYDLDKDPYELRNQAVNPAVATPSATQASLAAPAQRDAQLLRHRGPRRRHRPPLLRLGIARATSSASPLGVRGLRPIRGGAALPAAA